MPKWIVDLAQVIGAVGSLIALGFAAGSIRVAQRQGTAAARALVRERRIDFELNVLKELVQVSHLLQEGYEDGSMRHQFEALVTMLGPAVLPRGAEAAKLLRGGGHASAANMVRGDAMRAIRERVGTD